MVHDLLAQQPYALKLHLDDFTFLVIRWLPSQRNYVGRATKTLRPNFPVGARVVASIHDEDIRDQRLEASDV